MNKLETLKKLEDELYPSKINILINFDGQDPMLLRGVMFIVMQDTWLWTAFGPSFFQFYIETMSNIVWDGTVLSFNLSKGVK